jgi:y4mF family transcriptional regulator
MGMIMINVKDTEQFGTAIRRERKAQKLTQEELAAISGVGVRFLRELELGKESCQLGRALRVLETLGLEWSIGQRGGAAP